ncbi:MAG: T9SS type A sorting domain-containing protein [Flavobacteriales bacterium]|nr:T9SS type A sorting domain-containing protein [Flavobacteriales bacterium]
MKLFYACSALILSALALDASAQARPAKRAVRHGHVIADGTARGGGPANDICTAALEYPLLPGNAVVINGDNTGATIDEPALTGDDGTEYPAVWEAIVVPSCMDITVSFCGSLFTGTTFTGLFTDCDFSGIVRAFSTENTSCIDAQFTSTYRRVPAGTYLIPVAADPEGTSGAYTITVLGTDCADPVVENDECDGGVELVAGPGCDATTVDVTGASESLPAATCNDFTGTADDDVWFSFEATTTVAQITAQGSAAYDAVVEVFEGDCNGLTSLGCIDGGLDGEAEGVQVTELTVGDTYYVRVYDWYVGLPASTEVSLCVVEVPDVSNNDECPGTALTMGEECVPTLGTVAGATGSIPAIVCNEFEGVADDDVWHSFVATAANVVVAAQGGTDFDMVLELLEGPCGSPTSIACADASVENEIEQIAFSGLTVGTTYYVRLYSYTDVPVTDPTYQICVVAVNPPANEDCASAQQIEVLEPSECPDGSVIGSNALAEVSTGDPSCDVSEDGYADVWYTFNSIGNNTVTVELSNISMSDVGMEIVDACGGDAVFCAFGEDALGPQDITVDPATDYYVRVYSNLQYGEGGDFGLCVSAALSTALPEAVSSTFSVFPNPNDGRFQVVNNGEAMNAVVELFDATGRVVLSERVALPKGGVHSFDQAGRLAPGTYSLRMTSGDVRSEQRVLVR